MKSYKKKSAILFAFVMLVAFVSSSVMAEGTCTYYVSSSTGNDSNSGTSITAQWETINRVNQQTLYPGNTVCFKRGNVWRLPTDAYLNTRSGSATGGYITYTTYGDGPKPLFFWFS